MIEHLEIRNYVLIENLSIDFSAGFNVITGETGAGKSIILGAIGLLMGDKADACAIRNGTDELSVSAVVTVPSGHEAQNLLESYGISVEDGAVLIQRIVKRNGRSMIHIQGTPVTRSQLNDFSEMLIDVHGQREHQSLLISDRQRLILDAYSGSKALLEECGERCRLINSLSSAIEEIKTKADEGLKQMDYLQYALSEINAVSVQPGEDVQLKEKIDVLARFESIYENISQSISVLNRVRPDLSDVYSMCKKAEKYDASLSSFAQRTDSLQIEGKDIAEGLREYLDSVDCSPETLNSLQDRLSSIQKLKHKYGPSLEDVFSFASDAREKISCAQDCSCELENNIKLLEQAKKQYYEASSKLTSLRREASGRLQIMIRDTLRTLGMPQADFEISVNTIDDRISSHGSDRVDFLIAANPGEEKRNISEIASGGELSRVMLALKTVLAESDSIETQIFDEVDVGIGGTVALSLAKCIKGLSQSKQVIAVTHLASIASSADAQFVVSKSVCDGRTFTNLRPVSGDERACEIARMLSGDKSDLSINHAKMMLDRNK